MKKIIIGVCILASMFIISGCGKEDVVLEPFGIGYISSNADECISGETGIETCSLTYQDVNLDDELVDIKFTIDREKGFGEESNLQIYFNDNLIHTVEGENPSIEAMNIFYDLLLIHTHGGTKAFGDNVYAFNTDGEDILNNLPYASYKSFFKSYEIDEDKIYFTNTRIGDGTNITMFDIYKYDEDGNKTECYTDEEFFVISGLSVVDNLESMTAVTYLKSGSFSGDRLIGGIPFDEAGELYKIGDYIDYLCK